MTKIQNFINAGGTYNDNSESVITISPEGTKVEQHLHPQEKPVASDNSIGVESPVYLSDEKGAKIDIIRVFNVLYELGMFHGKDARKASAYFRRNEKEDGGDLEFEITGHKFLLRQASHRAER